MNEFKVVKKIGGGVVSLFLSGYLNEHARFEEITSEDFVEIHVDFEHVKFINSTGIARWTRFVGQTLDKYPKAVFRLLRCPRLVVDQINNVRGFLPETGIVDSFYLPYYNEECDQRDCTRSQNVLLNRGKDYKEKLEEQKDWITVPKVTCDRCGMEMEPDVVAHKYFNFLTDTGD